MPTERLNHLQTLKQEAYPSKRCHPFELKLKECRQHIIPAFSRDTSQTQLNLPRAIQGEPSEDNACHAMLDLVSI